MSLSWRRFIWRSWKKFLKLENSFEVVWEVWEIWEVENVWVPGDGRCCANRCCSPKRWWVCSIGQGLDFLNNECSRHQQLRRTLLNRLRDWEWTQSGFQQHYCWLEVLEQQGKRVSWFQGQRSLHRGCVNLPHPVVIVNQDQAIRTCRLFYGDSSASYHKLEYNFI